jgi:hypothetical protein
MSTYSPSLRVELITSGDQAGQWGTTTNDNFSYIFDSAIAGYVDVTTSVLNHVLTYNNGPVSDENLNQSIQASLRLNTSFGAAFNVFAPPVSKQYIIWNNSSFAATIYNSTVIGNTTAAGTGVTIAAGDRVLVFSDGTSFYTIKSSGITGILPIANGGTNLTSYNANGVLYASSASVLASGTTFTYAPTTNLITNNRYPTIYEWAAGWSQYSSGAFTVAATASFGSATTFLANNLIETGGTYRLGPADNYGNALVLSNGNFLVYASNTFSAGQPLVGVRQLILASPTGGITFNTSGSPGSLTNNGTTTLSSTVTLSGLTASTALALDASKNIVSVTNTGSGDNVLATSPTLVTPTLVTPNLGTPSSGNFSSGTFTWPTFNQNTTGTAGGLSSTLVINRGGTNSTATPTAGGVSYGTGSAYAFTSAGTSGQVLTSNGAGAPTWASVAANVSSVSFGSTGLTPSTATTGAVTVAGTLNVANGGTGTTTAQGAMNAFAGAVTAGSYLRGNGTNVVMATIQAADVPTLNQNTTGNAATATKLTTTNFTIEESGGKLIFKYGGTTIASMTSAGVFTALSDVAGGGTP